MKKQQAVLYYMGSFLLPLFIMVFIFLYKNFIPIPGTSNLTSDLYYQYIDYFSWFRNTLLSEGKIPVYSFSISLGNATLPLVAYYLASPLNLLTILFEQTALPYCILLITSLKIGLSGLTMSIYVDKRFPSLPRAYKLMASWGYALMYYNVAQATNIMWLDGVYMLPLILLASYNLLNNKSGAFLTITVCLSIVFNWYTAYMNCLFVAVYYIFECILKNYDVKIIVKKTIRLCIYELLGVCISGGFFIPVIVAMMQSKADFETAGIFSPSMRGDLLKIIEGLFPGGAYDDPNQTLYLFCGTAFLIFLVLFFLSVHINKREKFVTAFFLGIMLFSTQIYALENIWNGFRYATSFYCRFAYVVTFLVIFIALRAIDELLPINQISRKKLLCIVGTIFVVYLVFNGNIPNGIKRYSIYIYILLFYIIWTLLFEKKYGKQILLVITAFELLLNGMMVYRTGNEPVNRFTSYVSSQNEQIKQLRAYDDFHEEGNFFRVDETMNRQMSQNGIAAAYNDSMAYGYYGLSNYASTTYSKTVNFASKLGYYNGGHYIIPYSESILPSDSLLGIRYVLSQRTIPGYQVAPKISNNLNGKNVYYNEYALPLGILTANNELNIPEEENPFLFQNELYSRIIGEKCEIFKPASYSKNKDGDGIVIQTERSENPSDILYIYANTASSDTPVSIDGEYRTNYNRWLSYQTMCIGYGDMAHSVEFSHVSESAEDFQEKVYYLDMKLFKTIANRLQDTGFNPQIVKDEFIEGTFSSSSNGLLLLSVPFDEGWEITINNKPVEIQNGFDTFLAIPVSQGVNHIICSYHVPGFYTGIMVSIIGVALLLFSERNGMFRLILNLRGKQ